MKNAIVNTLFCVGFILSSCNQVSKNSSRTIEKDTIEKRDNNLKKYSSVEKTKDVTINRDDVVHFNSIKVDTIIREIHISFFIHDNNNVVSTRSYDDKGNLSITNYADRSVIISLRKKNKMIILNREIKKTDFISIIPQKEIDKYQLTSFQISKVTNEGVTFFVNVCVPDTDNCYTLYLIISNNGAYMIKQTEESEED